MLTTMAAAVGGVVPQSACWNLVPLYGGLVHCVLLPDTPVHAFGPYDPMINCSIVFVTSSILYCVQPMTYVCGQLYGG